MTAPATLLAALARRPASAKSDADLLGRFVADGDPTAFEELVRRYGRLVWRVARTRCRTDATAEDVFQATFAVLNRKAKTVRNPGALAGWLHRTANRLAVRATRRERPTVPLPRDLSQVADPLDTLTARELLAAVDDELAKLTETERAVLLLCGIDGVSNSDAAAGLGWSAGSVKGRLERARAKLRDRLAARGLTLPAVLVGLIGLTPPASAVAAAVALPIGGAMSPSVAELITETFTMKAKTALAATVAGLFLLTGGIMTDSGVTPTADAAKPRPVARRLAPVPKDAPKVVLWSEPVRVDWKGSGAESINGVWMPDGKSVLVPTPTANEKGEPVAGGGVDFRDAKTGKVGKSIPIREGRPKDTVVGDMAISAEGTLLCYATDPEHRRSNILSAVFDPTQPKYATCINTDYRARAVSCSAQGNCVACLSGQNIVGICKTAKGEFNLLHCLVLEGEKLHAVACHPTGSYVVAAGESGGLFPIRFATGGKMDKRDGSDIKFRAVAISPDGKTVAAGGEPGKGGQSLAAIDDCSEKGLGKEFRALKDAVPPKERINGLAFSLDGKHLAAACSDGILRVFDVKTGKLTASAKEHTAEVFSVAYSPDGKKLLTVGRDAMKVWDVAGLLAK